MSKALVQTVDIPKSMAEFAQLQAPQQEILKQSWLNLKIKKLWWTVSKKLWKTKDPLRYMCAVAELVIRTGCDEQTHNPTSFVFTAHNAVTMTRWFSTMIQYMTEDREFRKIPILTLGRDMTVAEFLIDDGKYVNANAHMNFHAVSLWILGRFALVDPKTLPEEAAVFNSETVAGNCSNWTAYLESILQARLPK